jgi:hypothetical protein
MFWLRNFVGEIFVWACPLRVRAEQLCVCGDALRGGGVDEPCGDFRGRCGVRLGIGVG